MEWQVAESFCKTEKIEYLKYEPMSRHTSFHIGGNADLFVLPENEEVLCRLISFLKENNIPFMVIGRGSNLVVSDNGIEGVCICLSNMNKINLIDTNKIYAQAGASLASVCSFAKEQSLSGLEFAYGIPGSIGGAMYMNAGAYGGEIKDVTISARVILPDMSITEINIKDMELSYRSSIFKKKNYIVLSAVFSLNKEEKSLITAKMDDFMNRRKTKQPLEYPSAGSVFKRPEGHFAGALIEKNGFKGVSVGGAQVSEKHAGFIINKGNATCRDVKALVEKIQLKVKESDGVLLNTELIFVGREE